MIRIRLLIRLAALSLLLGATAVRAEASTATLLPDWQVLEFEEKAFWAVANSRLMMQPEPGNPERAVFVVNSSVPGNSEQITMEVDRNSGQLYSRERLSRGKKDARFKAFDYGAESVMRVRREPASESTEDPATWSVTSRSRLPYPEQEENLLISDSYLLLPLAGRLKEKGPGATKEVLVHTDQNFYRVTLTCGSGIPIKTNYSVEGGEPVNATVDTIGVAVKAEPAHELNEKDDFALLGLYDDIIILFDQDSDLPLQVRGQAPRVGSTEINLKTVTPRSQVGGQ